MRKLYEYISVEQKKEVIEKLKQSLEQLDGELSNNGDSFSPFVRQILLSTKDKWTLEIELLQNDIKDNNES
ncbi:hypothetical protein OEV98_15895 [Caldibacillus lycopersici]|uniref:Uncharacterized protein n=1 Tax=Perspicuibacillus lycopersici TaxID=1325689 RepID=A0AAE3IWS1_9BACI|nr:hypothetical protein [Perspicuibacillus lycopersici]MCU9615018.1 hypothetical protein [Perspicuibacillus lycopersici]